MKVKLFSSLEGGYYVPPFNRFHLFSMQNLPVETAFVYARERERERDYAEWVCEEVRRYTKRERENVLERNRDTMYNVCV